MASTHPRGAQISGGAMASSPSGKTSMERSTSLEQQAKLQSQPTTLKMPSRKRADLFDSEDFDPTKLINQLYPDEASLTDLDKFVTVLKNQIQHLDQEIFNAVRSQGGAHARARQDLTVAHGQIEELFTKIRDIQRKSEESEVTVQEVCRDIKKLDYAKKHLTNSITALRRLAMLTAAVTDLEALCDRRDQYRKCANLIEAAHKLMECFQQYEAIPKVRSIALRLAAVEARLQYAVLNDFKILIGGPANDGLKMPPENLERLATACLVVDVLGKEVQDQVMDWLCSREMSIYQSAFGGAVGMMVGATAAADDRGAAVAAAHATRLDKFEQRFGWFRERLKEKREVWGVFPQHWRVPQMLCLTFCKITKAHLKRILSDEEALAGLRSDVGPLLKAVVATNRFERDMAALFGGGGGRQGAGGGADDGDDDSDPGGGGGADSMSASEARRRLEKFRARMKAEQQAARAAKDQQQAGTAVARISEAFEGVLVQYYVDQEERELLEALDGAVREEVERRWLPDEEEGVVTGRGTRVLQSANKIFFRIRASLTRCSKNVSRGPTLVALAQLFRRVLSGYAAELMRRLPKTAAGGTSANPAVVGGSTHWYVRLSEEDERVVCCLLATAEFCRDTTEGLGGALAKDVKPHFADRVDFGEVENAFVGVATACMNVLVLGINTRLDGPLLEMTYLRWDTIKATGDESPFVAAIRKVLLDCAPPLGAGLEAANLSFMCDKVARMFVPRLREAIFRLRRVADGGMMQLAIDMDAVQRSLLEFPRVARSARGEGSASEPGGEQQYDRAFTTYVEREMGHVVALVKVLQSRPEQLVDNYLLLMPPAAQSLMEFQRLCDLKALNRKQLSDLMGCYQLKAGQLGGRAGGGEAGGGTSTATGGGTGGAAGPSVGGDVGVGLGASSPATTTTNLGSLKASMNTFMRELAASIPFAGKRVQGGPEGGGGHVAGGTAAAAAAVSASSSLSPAPSGQSRGLMKYSINTSAGRRAERASEEWQDEGDRSASISAALASRCDVGRQLLDFCRADEEQASLQVQDLGVDASTTDPGKTASDPARRIVVPCVPGRVSTQGLATLDAWAMQEAAAQANVQPKSAWLPSFLFQNTPTLAAAICAADFLGCRAFLDLMLEVQLLRVAMMDTEQLNAAMSQDRTAATSWPPLKQAAFYQLPCLRPTNTCTPEIKGAERVRGGDGGSGGLPLRLVTPQQMETLVARLEADHDLMCFLNAKPTDIREGLYRLGFETTLVVRKAVEASVMKNKVPYLRLPLAKPYVPGFGATHYEVVAVTISIEAHDQGWSDYPKDHNTYHNSWTWGELVLVGEDGKPVQPGDPGRLYTNLHAKSEWQQHTKVLGPGSQLVRHLNARVFGINMAAQPAAAAAVVPAAADQNLADVQGCYSLALLMCACFPGWKHFVRRADLAVHLRPVDMGPEGCGSSWEVKAAAGEGEGEQEFWMARHNELISSMMLNDTA